MRTILLMLLGTVVIGLGVLNIELARTPIDTSPIAVSASVPEPSVSQIALKLPESQSLEEHRETSARPVFSRSRRPPQARPPVVEKSEPPADLQVETVHLRLTGIVQTGSSSRRALIVSPSEPSGRWLEEGAEIDGWRLVSIGILAVKIRAGERLAQLDMQ